MEAAAQREELKYIQFLCKSTRLRDHWPNQRWQRFISAAIELDRWMCTANDDAHRPDHCTTPWDCFVFSLISKPLGMKYERSLKNNNNNFQVSLLSLTLKLTGHIHRKKQVLILLQFITYFDAKNPTILATLSSAYYPGKCWHWTYNVFINSTFCKSLLVLILVNYLACDSFWKGYSKVAQVVWMS